jgi:hypothetical protein
LDFVIATFASLLPRRWLRRDLPAGAIILSGLAETVLGAILFVSQFRPYRFARSAEVHAPIGEQYPYGEPMVLGITLLVGFCFTSWGITAIYLFVEGLLRTAAGVVGQHCGLAPLYLISLIQGKPPVVADVVRADGDGWIVEGRHDDWDAHTTFFASDREFRLVDARKLSPGRFRYRLAPVPAGWIIRKQVRL